MAEACMWMERMNLLPLCVQCTTYAAALLLLVAAHVAAVKKKVNEVKKNLILIFENRECCKENKNVSRLLSIHSPY